MKNNQFFFFCCVLVLSLSSVSAQDGAPVQNNPLTQKEEKILQEKQADNLPLLPKGREAAAKKTDVPQELNINSEQVVKAKQAVPNDGKPYFTISGGFSPFQVSLGILKYFFAQWWGQAELGAYFFPRVPYANYFDAVLSNDFSPYIGFKVATGYAFYTVRDFEISLFATMQFAFIGTTDIPIIFGGGFRLIYKIFWLDLGVLYSLTAGGTPSPIFHGVQPCVALGFRF